MRARLILLVSSLAVGCGITLSGGVGGGGDAGPITNPKPDANAFVDSGAFDDAAAVDPDGAAPLPDANAPDDDADTPDADAGATPCGDVLYPEARSQMGYGGHCYWVTKVKSTGSDVYKACNAHSGHPVNISGSQENAVVYALAGKEGDDLWIGLRYTGGLFGRWQWYTSQSSSYARLYYGNGQDRNGGCAVMNDTQGGNWYTATCGSSKYVVCETEMP
jgi:hypothetical protein